MRLWVALASVLLACGARSEISGELLDGATFVDATVDVASPLDASLFDAAEASNIDASTTCCDLGFHVAGCQLCAAGETCEAKTGTCVRSVPNCNSTNCAGCCFTEGLCADGREVGSCGSQGQVCQTCIDANNKVSSCENGTCAGGSTCTPSNCVEGCCAGNVCMIGDQDTQCGNGAHACEDCSATQGQCVNGTCTGHH